MSRLWMWRWQAARRRAVRKCRRHGHVFVAERDGRRVPTSTGRDWIVTGQCLRCGLLQGDLEP